MRSAQILRLAVRGLLSRPLSTALSATALAIALIGFLLLGAVGTTTEATLSGDIARTWTTPYDILVRPAHSLSDLEASAGLVRPNFLSASTGGITRQHLSAIRRIPGVDIAAPVAIVGWISWPLVQPIKLDQYVPSNQPLTVLRVTTSVVGDAGMSHYPDETPRYLLAAPEGAIATGEGVIPSMSVGTATVSCNRSDEIRLFCFGGRTPEVIFYQAPTGGPGISVFLPEPILVAAIDPDAEGKLAPLDRCTTSGRALAATDRFETTTKDGFETTLLPAMLSDVAFTDASFEIRVEAAESPDQVIDGRDPTALTDWRPAGTVRLTAAELYRAFSPVALDRFSSVGTTPLWSVGDVSYQTVSPDVLAAKPREPQPELFRIRTVSPPYVPSDGADDWFRPVAKHEPVGLQAGAWRSVGRYDPACLPALDELAGGGGLDIYSVPRVGLPDGRRLWPNRAPGSYVGSPPVLLTTLDAADWLADPARFDGLDPATMISAVRVRVGGLDAPLPEAQAKLIGVARRIHDATGLAVDVVKGMSPRTVTVHLPAGRFGRPALDLTEGWSVKGVAVVFQQALATHDLALFSLVLVSAALFVGQAAFLSVRRRRRDFGLLRALGWPTKWVVGLVETEMLILGLAVGLVATAVSAIIAYTFGAPLSPGRAIVAVPLGTVITLLAGAIPAISASRQSPIGVIRRPGQVRSSYLPRFLPLLAARQLLRTSSLEAVLAAMAVALGGALVGGVVLIVSGFSGSLDTTVLGRYLALEVQPFHIVLAALAVCLGAASACAVVLLAYWERRPDYATLRALGWSARRVATVPFLQTVAIGLLGALTAGAIAYVLGIQMDAPSQSVALACSSAVISSVGATVVAAAAPFLMALRLEPMSVLRGD